MKIQLISTISVIVLIGCTSTQSSNNIESPPPTSLELVDSLGTRDEPLVCDVIEADNTAHMPSHCANNK